MSPIPAYSVLLWDLLPGYPIPGPQVSPSVPAGMVWVVREVTATNIAGSNLGYGIVRLVLNVGATPIFATPTNGTVIGRDYQLRNARHVMNVGETMHTNLTDQNWTLRVSGFQLTA